MVYRIGTVRSLYGPEQIGGLYHGRWMTDISVAKSVFDSAVAEDLLSR